MNKQELIKKYEGLFEKLYAFPVVTINEVLEDLKQLDEPQKPVVPQFVEDWIEEAKKSCRDVFDLFEFDFTNKEVGEWFLEEKPFDLVAHAWLDGYEVKEEKRYLVKMKGISVDSDCLNYDSIDDEWYLASDIDGCNVRTHHTRKELEEDGWGWVFDCPGIEIEEVE